MADNYDPNQNNPYQNNPYGNYQNSQYGNQYGNMYGSNPNGQDPNQMYQQQMMQQQMNRGMFGSQQPNYAPGQQGYYTGAEKVDVNAVLTRSFLFMFLALLITGVTALIVANSWSENGALGRFILGNKWGFIVFLIAEFALVIACNAAIKKNNLTVSGILFFLYSIVNGLTLSVIFLAYTKESITKVFFIAAGIFGVMAFLGAVTKIDLSKLGTILLIGLFGLIIATIINIFVKSSKMETIICGVGVLIFIGLTAYDTQKIKKLAAEATTYDPNVIGIYGAMELYLDFINLFLYLLRLFGKTNN